MKEDDQVGAGEERKRGSTPPKLQVTRKPVSKPGKRRRERQETASIGGLVPDKDGQYWRDSGGCW